jgi:hypothetical protein
MRYNLTMEFRFEDDPSGEPVIKILTPSFEDKTALYFIARRIVDASLVRNVDVRKLWLCMHVLKNNRRNSVTFTGQQFDEFVELTQEHVRNPGNDVMTEAMAQLHAVSQMRELELEIPTELPQDFQ